MTLERLKKENRIARMVASGKDNSNIVKKLQRQIRKEEKN